MLILSGALPHVQPSVANLAFASIAAQACGTVCLTYAAVALPPRAAPQGYCLFTAPDGGERGAAQLAAHDAPPAAQRVSSPLAVGSATMQTEPLLLSSGTSASIASRSMHRDVHVASPASGSTQFGSVRGSGTGSEGTAFLSAQASLASISTVASGALAPYSEMEETLASPSALQRALRREEGTRSGHLGVPDSVAAPLVRKLMNECRRRKSRVRQHCARFSKRKSSWPFDVQVADFTSVCCVEFSLLHALAHYSHLCP